jgi:L-rhamnonate dehydratase
MGPDGDIMCDCWCGWDHNYTVKMAQRLKDYNIKWIEEPLMPDDFEGFTRLRKILNPMGILLTTGEHEHSRWGIRELIDRGCADIVQCDTEYVGGVSELKKIMGYAAAHGVTVVPHTPNVPGMHVVFNSTASPFMERITHNFDHDMFITDYVDKDGYVTLSDSPGYGIELNPKYTRRIK